MTDPILIVGYAAAALTTVAFLPQVVKTWRSGSARDLSLPTLALMTSGVALWLGYGLATGDGPLAAANGVTLALVASLLALKLRDAARREAPAPAVPDA
jgi:MtN3 and saliva related transmembrane protein